MRRMVSSCAGWGMLIASMAFIGGVSNTVRAATTGKVAGEVVDQATGTPIPGAAVTIDALRLGGTTDTDGRYFIIAVPPGEYEVTAGLVGYTPVTQTNVVVNIDRTTPVNFALSASAIEVAGVTVVAPREVIQLDVAASRVTLDAKDVVAVPTVASLDAAIAQEPNVGGVSIRGGLADETQLMINGHLATDARLNTFSAATIPLTSVQEVQVLTSGFNAEYGNVRSGVINIVTRDDNRRVWGNARSTYAPPQKGHWGDEPVYGPNTLAGRVYGNDSLVEYHGVQVAKSLVTPYKVGTRVLFPGWLFKVWAPPKTTWTLQDSIYSANRMLQYWQHRHSFTDDDYAKYPTYTVDASIGGPVPFFHRVSWTYSHRNSSYPYLLVSARSAYTDWTDQFSLTVRLGPAKLTVTGRNTTESGIHTGPGNNVPTSKLPQRGGLLRGAEWKYSLYQGAPIDNTYQLLGVTLSHVLSASTQYELAFDAQHNEYRVGIWPMRYVYKVGGNPLYEEHALAGPDGVRWGLPVKDRGAAWMNSDTLALAPYGHPGMPSDFIDEGASDAGLRYYLGGGTDNADSSSYTSYKVRGSLTSQVNPHHQIKGGFDVQLNTYHERLYNEYLVTNQAHRIFYDRMPIFASGYVQDKVEYEGMILNAGVRLDYLDLNTHVYNRDSLFYSIPWEKGQLLPGRDFDLYRFLDSMATDHWSAWFGKFRFDDARTKVKWAPRLAISHPLDDHSKVYFNYGHFYGLPQTYYLYNWWVNPSGTGVSPRPNAELDLPRTIMYELAVEREFSNAFIAWLYGAKPQMQYLVRIAGFYKDVTGEVGTIEYYITATDRQVAYKSKRYAQIRGFEVKVQKRVGDFLTGWVQGGLSLRDQGAVGNLHENRSGALNVPESAYQVISQAEPSWSMLVDLHTPPDYAPFGVPSPVTELWTLAFAASYAQGAWTTYNPNAISPPPPLNVRYRDSWGSNLRLAKGFSFGRLVGGVYLDVTNVLGYKSLGTTGMTAAESAKYMESLHFPIKDEWKSIEPDYGDDRIGDWPDYAVVPDHDSWGNYLGARTYTFGMSITF